MCLSKLEETGLNEAGSGYKVFKKLDGGIVSPFRLEVHGVYKLGVWVKDTNTSPLIGHHHYKPGFHIFTEYPKHDIFHTRWYTIKRVKFRNGHTIGEDFGYKTVVCYEMKIKKFSVKVAFNKFRRWLENKNGL